MDGKNKALTPLYIILRFAEVHTSSSSYSNYGCLMLRLVLGYSYSYSYGYREKFCRTGHVYIWEDVHFSLGTLRSYRSSP